jgi:hypothetical protein
MGLGDYFFYKGSGSHRANKLSTKERETIAIARQEVFNRLNGINSLKDLEEKNRKTVASSELGSLPGMAHSSVNMFAKMINANEATKREKLKVYREMAKYPEIAFAIDQYVNEAINFNENNSAFKFTIRNKSILANENIRQTLNAEWRYLMEDVVGSSQHVDRWFRDFMIDGEIAFENIFDSEKSDVGITRVKKLMTSIISPIV